MPAAEPHAPRTFSSSAMSPLGVSTARLKKQTPPMADTPCREREQQHGEQKREGPCAAAAAAAGCRRWSASSQQAGPDNRCTAPCTIPGPSEGCARPAGAIGGRHAADTAADAGVLGAQESPSTWRSTPFLPPSLKLAACCLASAILAIADAGGPGGWCNRC